MSPYFPTSHPLLRWRYGLLCLLILAGLLLAPSPARADIAPPSSSPGTNPVPGSETTQVGMLAETVTLEVKERSASRWPGQARVTAVFQMQNLGQAEEAMEVRFPLAFSDGFGEYPEITDLRVKVDGRAAPTRRIVVENGYDPYADQPIPWAAFEARFPTGVPVQIEVTYTADGFGEGPYVAFRYIVATGAGWAGAIGSADFIVRLPYEADRLNVVFGATGFSNTTPGASLAGRELRWHFEDLEPTFENNLEVTVIVPQKWQQVLADRERVAGNPSDGEAWGRLGKAYKEMSRLRRELRGDEGGAELYQLSAAAYEQAVTLKPNDSLWHFGYADLLWFHYYWYVYWEGSPDTSELERVVSLLKRSLELDPRNERALTLLQDIQLSVPDVVTVGTDGTVDYLILTATPVITSQFAGIETPTALPSETSTALLSETPLASTTPPPATALAQATLPPAVTPPATAAPPEATGGLETPPVGVPEGTPPTPAEGDRLPFCAAPLALPAVVLLARKKQRHAHTTADKIPPNGPGAPYSEG